jgi:hypothetical protein
METGPVPRGPSSAPPFRPQWRCATANLSPPGEPSGDQHDQWIPQFFLRYVHAGLNLQEAIDTPAWHTEHSPRSSGRAALPGVLVAEETASLRSPSRNCADAVITPKSDPIGRRGVWSPPLPTGYVERPFGRISPT